jgi:RNA polymerase sigma-70 factor (ECF subfamily)
MTGETGQEQGPDQGPDNPAEVGALWREHRRWVAAVLLAHMPREADLEDLLQDVAVTVVTRIGELRDASRLRGWLRTVAINTARMAGRKMKVRRAVLRPLASEDNSLPDPSARQPWAGVAARAEAESALALAQSLPEEYREPLLLRCVRGLSQKQIAETLGLTETTVETRLARARRMLRGHVERTDTSRAAPKLRALS